MQAMLFSNCLKSQAGPEDLWPIRRINVQVKKLGGKALVQFREADETCNYNFAKSFEWTVEQFENAKLRLKKAGLRGTIALSESSGNDSPISFLKVQSPGFDGAIYTMYLRFRWAGRLNTQDIDAAKVLNEWKSMLLEVTPQ